METDPAVLAELRRRPEAPLPQFVFRALASRPSEGAHVDCRSLAEAVERLARGLQVLGEQASLERQAGDP